MQSAWKMEKYYHNKNCMYQRLHDYLGTSKTKINMFINFCFKPQTTSGPHCLKKVQKNVDFSFWSKQCNHINTHLKLLPLKNHQSWLKMKESLNIDLVFQPIGPINLLSDRPLRYRLIFLFWYLLPNLVL